MILLIQTLKPEKQTLPSSNMVTRTNPHPHHPQAYTASVNDEDKFILVADKGDNKETLEKDLADAESKIGRSLTALKDSAYFIVKNPLDIKALEASYKENSQNFFKFDQIRTNKNLMLAGISNNGEEITPLTLTKRFIDNQIKSLSKDTELLNNLCKGLEEKEPVNSLFYSTLTQFQSMTSNELNIYNDLKTRMKGKSEKDFITELNNERKKHELAQLALEEIANNAQKKYQQNPKDDDAYKKAHVAANDFQAISGKLKGIERVLNILDPKKVIPKNTLET